MLGSIVVVFTSCVIVLSDRFSTKHVCCRA